MEQLYFKTMDRIRKISNIIGRKKLRIIWEHQWNYFKEHSAELRHFLSNLEIRKEMDIRDAFYGGRVEGFTVYKKAKPGSKVLAFDINSLYPFILQTSAFPLG